MPPAGIEIRPTEWAKMRDMALHSSSPVNKVETFYFLVGSICSLHMIVYRLRSLFCMWYFEVPLMPMEDVAMGIVDKTVILTLTPILSSGPSLTGLEKFCSYCIFLGRN